MDPVWVPEPGRWYVGRADSGDDALVRVGGVQEAERQAVAHQHRVLARLSDPRIPAVVAHDERLPAIAVVAGVGTPLIEAVAQRVDESVVLTPATLVDLLREVASAIRHAHGAGVVHGHLDPELVVLGADGRVWVFGFGAEMSSPPAWTAPEVSRGEAPTRATDVWGIGALGLGLVLGQPPFRTADQARSGDCAAAIVLVTEQWPALGRLLARALAPAPSDRFPEIEGLCAALDELRSVAGANTERESLGALLWSRRSLMYRSMVGSAPTAVPLEGLDDRSEATDAMSWFGGSPVVPPRLSATVTSVVPRPMLAPEDATLGEDRPTASARPVTIEQAAPVVAGAMVVLLILWLVTVVF
ncbi:MAG: hypothetical protein ABMA64_26490 [Myxococcota bacterium]